MKPFQILPSTTSHKNEPLVPTLEVFSRLGMRDLDLNLHHIFEQGLPVASVRKALDAGCQRVWIASGGWCDFSHRPPQIDATFESVDRQVAIAQELDAHTLRLFFGRLSRADYCSASLAVIVENMRRVSARHSAMTFVFENHDGASLVPAICREILETVDRPNVRMNFDPINFERGGVNSTEALAELRPLTAHVHLKGCRGSECCEFGAGDVDLRPLVQSLVDGGYRGAFTVEYEGPGDKTVRLYEGFRRAQVFVGGLADASQR